jgi:hypothetical protein
MSCDGTAPDGDVRSINAAGAPLVRIAAIRDRGGAGGPAAWVSLPTMGGAAPPTPRDGPETDGGATGAGVEAEGAAAEPGPAGAVAAESGLAGAESATAEEGALTSVTGADAGAGRGAGTATGVG